MTKMGEKNVAPPMPAPFAIAAMTMATGNSHQRVRSTGSPHNRRRAVVAYAFSEVSEILIDLECVSIPPTVTIGLVVSWGRCLSKGDALHLALRVPHLVDRSNRRNRFEDLEANVLAETDGREVRIFPDAVRTGDDDGQKWASELLRDPEGAGVEGCLDAEDASLREDDEALVAFERFSGPTQQRPIPGRSGASGDARLTGGAEVRTEEPPLEQFVACGEREVERDACDDERIDESFVQWDNDVFLMGIYMIEAGQRDPDSECPGHDRGPHPLEAMKEVTPTKEPGGDDRPPERSEEECRYSRQTNPGGRVVDARCAARERYRVSRFGGHRNGNGPNGPSIPMQAPCQGF